MVKLPRKIYDEMISHAKEASPNECCGLLAGVGITVSDIYRIQNLPPDDPTILALAVPADRRFRYVMDPKEQLLAFKRMREKGTVMLGIYHSHPHSPAYPSETDVRLAYYPDAHYLIVSLKKSDAPVVRAFCIVEQKVIDDTLEVFPST